MSPLENVQTHKHFNTRELVQFFIGGVVGAAVVYAGLTMLEKAGISIKHLSHFDYISICLGICFIGMALITAVLSTSRKYTAETLEGEPTSVLASAEEIHSVRLQALTLGLAGVLLLTPPIAQHFLPGHPYLAATVFVAVVTLFLLQTAVNIQVWRISDEFVRKNILLTCTFTLAIFQGVLFLWAAAEHLQLVPSLSAWNIYLVHMFIYLATSFMLALRLRR